MCFLFSLIWLSTTTELGGPSQPEMHDHPRNQWCWIWRFCFFFFFLLYGEKSRDHSLWEVPVCVCLLSHFNHVQLCATLRTVSCQAPLSMGFSEARILDGLPCPPPGDLPNPGIEPMSLMYPELAGRFFTTSMTREVWEAPVLGSKYINRGSRCWKVWGHQIQKTLCLTQTTHSLHVYRLCMKKSRFPIVKTG